MFIVRATSGACGDECIDDAFALVGPFSEILWEQFLESVKKGAYPSTIVLPDPSQSFTKAYCCSITATLLCPLAEEDFGMELLRLSPPLVLGMFAVTFAILWRTSRPERYLACFASGFALLFLAKLIQYVPWPPDPGLNTAISGALALAAILFCVDGALARSGLRLPPVAAILFFVVITGVALYLTYAYRPIFGFYARAAGTSFLLLFAAWELRFLLRGTVSDKAIFWMLIGPGLVVPVRTLLAGPLSKNDEAMFLAWEQFSLSLTGVVFGICVVMVRHADLVDRLRNQRDHDPLTGLLNRRGFQAASERAVDGFHVNGASVMVGDIDHFKRVNDTFGHAAGDAVLRQFADILQTSVRIEDVVGRHGGEEFVVLFPDCSVETAYTIAERLRKMVAHTHFLELPKGHQVTCSLGIAKLRNGEDLWEGASRADEIMYAAKQGGRNKTFAEGIHLPKYREPFDPGHKSGDPRPV